MTIWVREGYHKIKQLVFSVVEHRICCISFIIIFEKLCDTGLNLRLFGRFFLLFLKIDNVVIDFLINLDAVGNYSEQYFN